MKVTGPLKGVGNLSVKQVEHATNEMIEGMERLKDDVPKLPEHTFREYLLPVLANSAKGEKVDLNIWTDIAGTTYRPIDVVDLNGAVLFRCPSLHRQLPTEVRDRSEKSARNSVMAIVARTELLSKNSPRAGAAHLQNALLGTKVPNAGVDLERARAFDAILRRYGYPGILPQKALATTEGGDAATPATDQPQIEGFDEFGF